VTSLGSPSRVTLEEPEFLLRWIQEGHESLNLDLFDGIDIWGLVALASVVRSSQTLTVELSRQSGASRFAHAVGFRELTNGTKTTVQPQPNRTVPLQSLSTFPQVEPTSRRITDLLVQGIEREEIRRTIHYVLVELLRNVVQHSQDPSGGIVAAQVMSEGPYHEAPAIQVAVADCGIGIPESLRGRHPDLDSAEEALDKALWPYFSGAFDHGLTGTQQNAGMGLFFISEMAKLTASRLLIATRGASLFIWGDREEPDTHEARFLSPAGLGFPGTLVAFELPFETAAKDYDGLIQVITGRAKERTPQRATTGWFRYDEPPPQDAAKYVITVAAEDTVAAEQFSKDVLQPAILDGRPIVLVFANVPIVTQSYLHSLLYEVVRLAWAKRVPIYIDNAKPAVRSSLELLERYALGG
jgi:hypothetical protein